MEVHESTRRVLKRPEGLADTNEEVKKEMRTMKRMKAAGEAKDDPDTAPIDSVRERNVKEAAEGKLIMRAKF